MYYKKSTIMFFDSEITNDLFYIPLVPPPLRRQYGCGNLFELSNSENCNLENCNLEVTIKDNVFKSIPNLECNNTSNSPSLKRCNSETKSETKITEIKRINTF